MTTIPSPQPPPELLEICSRWGEAFEQMSFDDERRQYMQAELPAVLLNKDLFINILRGMVQGSPYPDIRQAQMIDDEILLYLNPRRLFSLRMFLYAPGAYTPIHDHNAWGISGSALGNLEIIKYRRLDDGSTEGYAKLQKSEVFTLAPGATEVTLPLNAGIHQTGNPTAETIIMVSVYGKPMRRTYIQCFDSGRDEVVRVYPPRIKKRNLAAEALRQLDSDVGKR